MVTSFIAAQVKQTGQGCPPDLDRANVAGAALWARLAALVGGGAAGGSYFPNWP
jgi:hypothetical protein